MDSVVINYMISAAAGAFGVGAAWGALRYNIRHHEARITSIEHRQKVLRGEIENGGPVFMPRENCMQVRTTCHAESDRISICLREENAKQAKSIKALENFARWFLQDKGLKISEINEILRGED